jgi:hypothetical protein
MRSFVALAFLAVMGFTTAASAGERKLPKPIRLLETMKTTDQNYRGLIAKRHVGTKHEDPQHGRNPQLMRQAEPRFLHAVVAR